MTERCKRNPCCGDYLECKPPPQFKPRESYEDYQQRIAKPASEPAGGDVPVEDSLVLVRRDMLASACAAIRLKKDAPKTVEYLRAAALSSSAGPAEPVARVTIEEVGPVCKYFSEIDGRLASLGLGTHDLYAHPTPATVEMREEAAQAALARMRKLRDQYADQAKFADVDEARLFRQFVERLDRAALAPATEGGKS